MGSRCSAAGISGNSRAVQSALENPQYGVLHRHLVTYMNGTADADTIADPATFFSLLCTFAAGLDAAHADNVAADKVLRATCPTSATVHPQYFDARPLLEG